MTRTRVRGDMAALGFGSGMRVLVSGGKAGMCGKREGVVWRSGV